MAESAQGPEASLTRVRYDPELVANVGAFKNRFVLPIHAYEEEGEEFVAVRLTARGNEALREVCHTADQKEVWRFPSYEFVVRKDSLSVAQVSDNFCCTRIGLIELVDPDCPSLLCQCSSYCFPWSPTTFFLYEQHSHCVCGGRTTPWLLGWFLRGVQMEGSWCPVFICRS